MKERELSGEFSPSDKRRATPNSSSSNNNQWSKQVYHDPLFLHSEYGWRSARLQVAAPVYSHRVGGTKFLFIPCMSPYMLASSRGHWDKLILVLQLSKEACRYANDGLWAVPGPGSLPTPPSIPRTRLTKSILEFKWMRSQAQRVFEKRNPSRVKRVPRGKTTVEGTNIPRPRCRGWGSWQRKEIGRIVRQSPNG